MADSNVESWLETVIHQLVTQGAITFYCGDRGGFDGLVGTVLQREKVRSPHIQRVLVLAYLQEHPWAKRYDYATYPELEQVPKRFAILKRNQWMVQQSDLMVAYVQHGVSNAVKTLELAKKKPVILYPHLDVQPLPPWV